MCLYVFVCVCWPPVLGCVVCVCGECVYEYVYACVCVCLCVCVLVYVCVSKSVKGGRIC